MVIRANKLAELFGCETARAARRLARQTGFPLRSTSALAGSAGSKQRSRSGSSHASVICPWPSTI
jgi:hypothetical protein